MPTKPPENIRALRIKQVCAATGLSRSTVYDLEAAGQFPKRLKLSKRCSAWIESEVQEFLAHRMASRETQAGSHA